MAESATAGDSRHKPLSESDLAEIVTASMSVKGLPAIVTEEWVKHAAKQGRCVHDRLLKAKTFLNAFGSHYGSATIQTFLIDSSSQQTVIDGIKKTVRDFGNPEQFKRNILFYGSSGVGKDHLLYCMAMNAIFYHGHQVHWVNASRLYSSLWQGLNDRNLESVLQPLMDAQVLAISDPILTTNESSSFILDKLKDVIDYRYRKQLPTWLTVNAQGTEDIYEFFGETAGSRLVQNSIGFPCFWENYRTTN